MYVNALYIYRYASDMYTVYINLRISMMLRYESFLKGNKDEQSTSNQPTAQRVNDEFPHLRDLDTRHIQSGFSLVDGSRMFKV